MPIMLIPISFCFSAFFCLLPLISKHFNKPKHRFDDALPKPPPTSLLPTGHQRNDLPDTQPLAPSHAPISTLYSEIHWKNGGGGQDDDGDGGDDEGDGDEEDGDDDNECYFLLFLLLTT